MKISELSTDKAADVLCEVSAYALNIVTDEKLQDSLKAQIDAEKPQTAGERYAVGAQKISQWIPILLKKHRDDVLGILSAVNDTSIEVRELVKDKDLMDFFKSCASEAKA